MKIALISCTKLKQDKKCSAAHMYDPSPLFKKAKSYVSVRYNHWLILSAKHGALHPSQVIDPYDYTLNGAGVTELRLWSESVFQQIMRIRPSEVDFYAGKNYRKFLIPLLEQEGIVCNVPLEGKGIGEQLSFYTKENKK